MMIVRPMKKSWELKENFQEFSVMVTLDYTLLS